LDELTLYTANS